jgi:hypothetical protein
MHGQQAGTELFKQPKGNRTASAGKQPVNPKLKKLSTRTSSYKLSEPRNAVARFGDPHIHDALAKSRATKCELIVAEGESDGVPGSEKREKQARTLIRRKGMLLQRTYFISSCTELRWSSESTGIPKELTAMRDLERRYGNIGPQESSRPGAGLRKSASFDSA